MSNHLVSLIRTYVPIVVGVALTWLAAKTGVVIDDTSEQGLVVGFTAIVTAIYYAVARWLEEKNPAFGILLGSKQQPEYSPPSK